MTGERGAPVLEASNLSLRYAGASSLAVSDFSLAAAKGEVITLLGPSGCGKTSALRLIAGLERPAAGTVQLNGRDITDTAPELRRMGFVFQNYALFPHLSVAENVAFGLRVRRLPKAEIVESVNRSLALVNLEGFGDRRIDQLSGGQQQRVALARALAIEPAVLLLDEPLSNLDVSLREATRDALRDMLSRLGITTLFVTHDQSEAFAFSDTIILMNAGRIIETGDPERLYRAPEQRFTAEFIGSANVLDARVARQGASVSIDGERPDAIEVRNWSDAAQRCETGSSVLLVARVETLSLHAEGGANRLPGRVVDSLFLGATYRVTVQLDSGKTSLRLLATAPAQQGPVWVHLPADAIRVIITGT